MDHKDLNSDPHTYMGGTLPTQISPQFLQSSFLKCRVWGFNPGSHVCETSILQADLSPQLNTCFEKKKKKAVWVKHCTEHIWHFLLWLCLQWILALLCEAVCIACSASWLPFYYSKCLVNEYNHCHPWFTGRLKLREVRALSKVTQQIVAQSGLKTVTSDARIWAPPPLLVPRGHAIGLDKEQSVFRE